MFPIHYYLKHDWYITIFHSAPRHSTNVLRSSLYSALQGARSHEYVHEFNNAGRKYEVVEWFVVGNGLICVVQICHLRNTTECSVSRKLLPKQKHLILFHKK